MNQVPCILVDYVTQAEIKNERGEVNVNLPAAPSVGSLVSFARKAWNVREVWLVHNDAVRVIVTPEHNPKCAELSYR